MYITGFSVTLLLVLYLPLTIWGLRKLWPRLPARLSIRASVTVLIALMLAAIPLWDVTLTTVKMAELCPQAGLFVKRSVKVDGYYTNTGSAVRLDRGFKYIEEKSYGDRIIVNTKVNAAVKEEIFDAKTYQIKSRYEYIYDAVHGAVDGRRDIAIRKAVVRDRETKEELGYALRYAVFPGWVDRNTIGLLGMVGWVCAQQDQEIMLMEQALLPN
jgi:hypothetical protein